jgi:hypothetical protein
MAQLRIGNFSTLCLEQLRQAIQLKTPRLPFKFYSLYYTARQQQLVPLCRNGR